VTRATLDDDGSGSSTPGSSRSEGTFHLYAPDFPALLALSEDLWEDCCKRGKSSGC
jgi:hypothetical protein